MAFVIPSAAQVREKCARVRKARPAHAVQIAVENGKWDEFSHLMAGPHVKHPRSHMTLYTDGRLLYAWLEAPAVPASEGVAAEPAVSFEMCVVPLENVVFMVPWSEP